MKTFSIILVLAFVNLSFAVDKTDSQSFLGTTNNVEVDTNAESEQCGDWASAPVSPPVDGGEGELPVEEEEEEPSRPSLIQSGP